MISPRKCLPVPIPAQDRHTVLASGGEGSEPQIGKREASVIFFFSVTGLPRGEKHTCTKGLDH